MTKRSIPESDKIKLGISTSVLFDMSEADAIWRAEQAGKIGMGSYRTYMMSKVDEPLQLRQDMIDLLRKKLESGKYSFVLMSKNSALCGMRAIHTLVQQDLIPMQVVLTNGAPIAEYAKIYGVDIFQTTVKSDAELVDALGVSSAYYDHSQPISQNKAQRIIKNLRNSVFRDDFKKNADFIKASRNGTDPKIVYSFDFDKVLGGPESDDFYATSGRDMDAYRQNERDKYHQAVEKAPWFNIYEKIMSKFHDDHIVHINTARSSISAMRMLNTLSHWGIEPNGEIHCTGHMDKTPVLLEIQKRYGDVTFYDDGQKNVDRARKAGIRTGHVPSTSKSNLML